VLKLTGTDDCGGKWEYFIREEDIVGLTSYQHMNKEWSHFVDVRGHSRLIVVDDKSFAKIKELLDK
jgi:hypothetical protein